MLQRPEDETLSRAAPGAPYASPVEAPVAHRLLGGRFLLVRELGRGGTGTVFEARDLVLGQRIAVKVLHPDRVDPASRERLRREVRAARPGHPNAVAVYELHDSDGFHYLTLELVEGESLRTAVAAGRPFEVGQLTAIGRQVAEALAHFHRRGLVHRDVKPGNILLAADGVAKLCDLGLARPVAEGVTVTETEMVVGTPAYMAPEQAMGGELQPASDVYALGLTVCHALTGEVPLRADTALATLSRRQRERPPSVRENRPDCPRWLDGLLRRMLDPDPRERPTAAQVARALALQRSLWRPRRQQLAVVGALAAVMAVVAVGVSQLMVRKTVEVQVSTDTVSGRGRDGAVTWSRQFPRPLAQHAIVDLDGDGRVEVIAATEAPVGNVGGAGVGHGSEIEVRRLDGRVLTRLEPDRVVRWSYSYPVRLSIRFSTIDVDHDGILEIVAACPHATFFPTAILVYWTREGRWEHVVNHAGHVYDIEGLPGDGGAGFWIFGVNNRLGFLPLLARVDLSTAPRSRRMEQGICTSPPDGSSSSGRAALDPYVLLDEPAGSFADFRGILAATAGAGVRVERIDGSVLELDLFANPIPGPNAGRDLRLERARCVEGLAELVEDMQPEDPGAVLRIHHGIEQRSGRVLDERPYRVALELMTARAQARAGDLDGGLERLRTLVQAAHWDDPMFRLAHLEALAGNLEAAGSVLREMMERATRPRARYDAPLLYRNLAIARHDPVAVGWAARRLGRGWGGDGAILEASCFARARLWWDRVEPGDLEFLPNRYLPAAGAISCLARWRAGRLLPTDAAEMAKEAEASPDVEAEFRIAEAAALLGSGRVDEALEQLERVDIQFESRARDDFSVHQLLELERALHAVALVAAGRPDRAREAAAGMLSQLDPELLPGILVREVLADLER